MVSSLIGNQLATIGLVFSSADLCARAHLHLPSVIPLLERDEENRCHRFKLDTCRRYKPRPQRLLPPLIESFVDFQAADATYLLDFFDRG